MKMVALNTLCQINIGKTPSRSNAAYWGKGYKWLAISDMKSKYITKTKEEITDLAIKESKIKIVPKNTVLMSFKLSIGKLAITQENIYTNEAIASFPIIQTDRIIPEYLYYALKTLRLESLSDRAVMGATLNKSKLNGLEIPLPDINIQKKLVNILNKAEDLIEKRKNQIESLTKLTSSLFFEIFGDTANNTKKFRIKQLVETCLRSDDIRCGPFGTQLHQREFVNSGVPLWGIKHVNKHFSITTDEYVSFKKAEMLKNYNLLAGDLIMTRKGTVGKCAIYPDDLPQGIMHSDLLRIRLDQSVLDPIFLMYQLKLNKDIEHQLSQISSGAIMKGLNVTKLKEIKVLVPPIELQKNFSLKIEEVMSLLKVNQLSLEKLIKNHSTLLQSHLMSLNNVLIKG